MTASDQAQRGRTLRRAFVTLEQCWYRFGATGVQTRFQKRISVDLFVNLDSMAVFVNANSYVYLQMLFYGFIFF